MSTMRAFASDKEMAAFMRRLAARQRTVQPSPTVMYDVAPAPPAVAAPAAEPVQDRATGAQTTSITNTQEADVDEGGIVKVAGDHLVILRRGRLFTVSLAGNSMNPVDHIDAFPPKTSGDAWYDEMLVSGDRVIVVGYSYERGGTEINRFRISPSGRLRFEDSYHLRSNDYYSASNYASRLVGSTLIFYTPLYINAREPLAALPGLQRWTGNQDATFTRTLPATRLYVPEPLRRTPDADLSTLHTVTQCDLTAPRMTCRATAVLGSTSRTFYVSAKAVYVWTDGDRAKNTRSGAFVYRLPLDGSAPSALQAWGGPVDQFSFAENRAAQRLNVVVRTDSAGDAMWQSERSAGATALLTLPISAFGDGSRIVPASAYRSLPVEKDSWNFHNRFVGKYLIYSGGEFNEHSGTKLVYAVPLNGGAIAPVPVPHGVDRIDIIGTDAIAIGNDMKERLGFSAIELVGKTRLGDTYFLPAAHEGERRSQAFFYRPDETSFDGASGMLGLPVTRDLENSAAARFLGSGSAIAFLRRDARRFSPAGELVANAEGARDDACTASCVDWYGNARPIFLNGRVFALMGYELVEGRVSDGLIGERSRIDFAPRTAR
ncbi:beta-propeller domain-containing protein [Sphingomonas oligophenolica]|uniref:Beta-propeller domain-containing protein n=1 Tax=Sphingomonas oligophenolica TaxID=301154 RepID=A0ABU9XX26_9SPHN